MDSIKPRITAAGYKKALQEYGLNPSRIIEELVANSYDADATSVLVIHSDHEIIVADNGTGITDEQFPRLLDLGAGTKVGSHDSELKRSYLGSFGFGIKAMINIAKTIWIYTVNKHNYLSCDLDIHELESKGFHDNEWTGFPIEHRGHKKGGPTGTIIRLRLRSDLTPEQIESIKASLYNLPKVKNFAMYLVDNKKVAKHYSVATRSSILSIKNDVKKLTKERITGSLNIGKPKVLECKLGGSGTMDVEVWCNGLDANMKVPSLGPFAGVYVKVDGRVLKRNFQGEKVLDGISKYPKFKHGMRIEVPIDWLKEQISLGRDGLQFGNESSKKKFENELKSAVTTAVKPFAKQLEQRKLKKVSRETDLRMRKAKERIEKKREIKHLVGSGYAYAPTDDYEMALLIANPKVLKQLCDSWTLMDFNGQSDFDCLIYDKKTTNFHKVELEPILERFLGQAFPDNTEYIITWTRGDWKVGKGKKGKRGYYVLEDSDGLGHYKLLIKASHRSQEPKQILRVFCLDTAIKS